MFHITSGKGFHIAFANGVTASVQFGAGNYCDHHRVEFGEGAELAARGSTTAECCAFWTDGSEGLPLGDVRGWQSPEGVLRFLTECEAYGRGGRTPEELAEFRAIAEDLEGGPLS